MSSTDNNGLSGCRPILCVESAIRSIGYYVGCLGFRLGWAWSQAEQRFLQPGENREINFGDSVELPVVRQRFDASIDISDIGDHAVD